ncbi:hypothetical protein ACODT5_03810 [Streptomyces sp. 5.8]|uniref:hypothetical protein n=1 Tax=Streptomyces sp. 5.8 TaxID=3406571 RepID=UPI003BB684A8
MELVFPHLVTVLVELVVVENGVLRIVGALGVDLAARAVVRLGLVLGIVVSRMTVLRVVMALPEPVWAVPRVLGLDEFATWKGRRYGTILIDCETHQPLGPAARPGGRDPGRMAARTPRRRDRLPRPCGLLRRRCPHRAPQAPRCADKWHVWHNLGEAVERLVSHHRVLLRDFVEQKPSPEPVPTSVGQEPSEPYPAGKFLDPGSATPTPRSGPRSSRACASAKTPAGSG